MLYGKILYHSTYGYFTILSDDYYIRKLEFGKRPLPEGAVWLENHPLLQMAEQQLMEYFDGKRLQFSLPLAPDGTTFQKVVWDALQQIPYGETVSYGILAKMLGRPKAARAVGGACHQNKIVIVIPCHRVVGANGDLTGFGGGIPLKKALLDLERKNQDKEMFILI